MTRHLLLALALAAPSLAHAQQPLTATEIMTRVAANQDASESARLHYLYVQHSRTQSRKGHTIMCEETTDYRITPTTAGSDQQLLKLEGRLLRKGQYIPYATLGPKASMDDINISIGDDDSDRDLVENTRHNLIGSNSKDGIAAHLFPLTTKAQPEYQFHLIAREHLNGRDVYHLDFKPTDNSQFDWKGDAYIDTTAFQPVLIRTRLSRNIPAAVRILLGTSVPGLGFSVTYAPQPDGVWFPVSFGTEFKIHVLFFFSREIVLDARNLDFEKTHTSATVVGASKPVDPTPNP